MAHYQFSPRFWMLVEISLPLNMHLPRHMHIFNFNFKEVLILVTSSGSVLLPVNTLNYNIIISFYNYFITYEDHTNWIKALKVFKHETYQCKYVKDLILFH